MTAPSGAVVVSAVSAHADRRFSPLHRGHQQQPTDANRPPSYSGFTGRACPRCRAKGNPLRERFWLRICRPWPASTRQGHEQGETMKLNSAFAMTVMIAALGSGGLLTACSSTPTHESTGEVIDDSWITTKVKSAFVEDPTVSALNVKVDTYKGVVQLSGFANNTSEIQRAADIARGVKGVKEVHNDIRLKTNAAAQ
jgi:hypothetical protein